MFKEKRREEKRREEKRREKREEERRREKSGEILRDNRLRRGARNYISGLEISQPAPLVLLIE
jgi:hypothetical protein